MQTLDELIKLLKMIVPIGVTFRVIFCFIKMMYSEDERNSYKKKIINIIVFGVIAELILNIKDLIMFYYQ